MEVKVINKYSGHFNYRLGNESTIIIQLLAERKRYELNGIPYRELCISEYQAEKIANQVCENIKKALAEESKVTPICFHFNKEEKEFSSFEEMFGFLEEHQMKINQALLRTETFDRDIHTIKGQISNLYDAVNFHFLILSDELFESYNRQIQTILAKQLSEGVA